jgi:hypothetical protein
MGKFDVFPGTKENVSITVDVYDSDVTGKTFSFVLSKREAAHLIVHLRNALRGKGTRKPRWRE